MSIAIPFDAVCHTPRRGEWCGDGGEKSDERHIDELHRTPMMLLSATDVDLRECEDAMFLSVALLCIDEVEETFYGVIGVV